MNFLKNLTTIKLPLFELREMTTPLPHITMALFFPLLNHNNLQENLINNIIIRLIACYLQCISRILYWKELLGE